MHGLFSLQRVEDYGQIRLVVAKLAKTFKTQHIDLENKTVRDPKRTARKCSRHNTPNTRQTTDPKVLTILLTVLELT